MPTFSRLPTRRDLLRASRALWLAVPNIGFFSFAAAWFPGHRDQASQSHSKEPRMARVTGIGGIFLKARDPKSLSAWYSQHLGIQLADYGGATFLWSDELPAGTGQTAWMLFPETTKHFGAETQRAMVNYRVDDLDALLAQLADAGVPIDPKREDAPYGKFAWITDPEGNRLELWQPLKH